MTTIQLDQDILHSAGLGAFFRPSEVEKLGITYDQLVRLVQAGVVERVQRGLYRLVSTELTEHATVAAVCARVPNAVVCLITALNFYEIGTQLSPRVWIAIHHKARPPRLPQIRTRLVRFSGAAWTYGVREAVFNGVPARITSPARTIVDCFRFERLIGREAALEALHEGLRERKVTVDALMRTLEELPSRRLSTALEFGVL
ncbi:MAG: type IV toxin-antitoxin system AbiEi family antitoxin domain-containing protein [Gemmatimonadetes bacterium]|nr:type IV toxin-antitoxin system AbiEi family antitoxin domain-containing protein [Gemmatimonadota bacterium]